MTARESMLIYEKQKAQERNRQKYHTEEIRLYSGETVAESENWIYKVVIFSDNSAALHYIAKPGSGCASGHYCGIDILKHHMKETRPDWHIIQPGFFEALNIPTENREAAAEAVRELFTA